MFATAVMSLTSCLGDSVEYTYYDDAAITSFKLGTLKRTIHTVSKTGADSTYQKSLNCSGYVFSIDQLKGEIWNEDSLPVGTDASKAICTVASKNSGAIGVKSMTSDSLSTYSSKDSIDFSQPRTFSVFNTNSTGSRDYTIRVNVHQEEGDSCVWTKVASANENIANLTGMKAFSLEDKIYLYGTDGNTLKLYTTALTDGVNWSEVALTPALSADAYKGIIMKKDIFFCITNGELLKSTDAANWQKIIDTDFKQLIAATSAHLYALSADNKIMSSADEGTTWIEEELDANAAYLPTENLSYASRTLQTNADAEKIVLIGNRSSEDYPNDYVAFVWTKIDEYSDGSRNHAWSFISQSWENKNRPARAENWQIVNYDGQKFRGVCGNGLGNNPITALNNIFTSGDDGITWIKDQVMRIPADLSTNGTSSFAMTTDKSNSVWIICGATGQVWKTRINRLVWNKKQDIFE